MNREQEISELSKTVCQNFVSFSKNSSHKKDWSLLTVVGGPGTGKTRLSICAQQLIKEEIQKNRNDYSKYIDNRHDKPEEILRKLEDNLDRPRSTIYLDFSNGDFIDDYRDDRKIMQSLLFS